MLRRSSWILSEAGGRLDSFEATLTSGTHPRAGRAYLAQKDAGAGATSMVVARPPCILLAEVSAELAATGRSREWERPDEFPEAE